MRLTFIGVVALLLATIGESFAQKRTIKTEAITDQYEVPIDGIVTKTLVAEKRLLPYQQHREADILWEKKVWRIIDIREKINLPFAYPERPFFQIVMEAAINGDVRAYSTENDRFSFPLTSGEVASMGVWKDTMLVFDFDQNKEVLKVVQNTINYEDVKRFRLKEVWYFDEAQSRMDVRILGIAPLWDVKDDNGNFIREQPLFWVYYPECRKVLAKEQCFNPQNDAAPMTWEDWMEMRVFSSYIYKASNVRDERIQDYISSELDRLLEADKIRQELFNLEHDFWSY